MQCKVINSAKHNLETDVNNWLQSGNYEISYVLQTENPTLGYITLTIFYLTLKESRKKKLDNLSDISE